MFLERIEVSSYEIASIGYDDAQQKLQIEFHNLTIFDYFEVPRDVFEQFVCADNIENYFQAHIENYFEVDRVL